MPIVHGHTVRIPRRRNPAERMPGQHARATFLRLRLRTLVTLGVLAVLTTVLGRAFGLHSPLFIGSELALLITMFAVSRYVLPLVDRQHAERHERAQAQAQERRARVLPGHAGGGIVASGYAHGVAMNVHHPPQTSTAGRAVL